MRPIGWPVITTEILNLRRETYQDTAFFTHWKSSKLHAIIKLLNKINHNGRIHVFGDGKYDMEMITYFDGTLITKEKK